MILKLKKCLSKLEPLWDREDLDAFGEVLDGLKEILSKENYPNSKAYKKELKRLDEEFEEVNDRESFLYFKKALLTLIRQIINENKKIFVVHGRDINMRNDVTSFLSRVKQDCIILEYEKNSGNTVIEKFIEAAKECDYAVVLFSSDDRGKYKEESHERPRPRQNVLLELGYFLAKVGRSHIFILHEEGDIEKPSDFAGIVYESYDSKGAWKVRLVKELRATGQFVPQEWVDKSV